MNRDEIITILNDLYLVYPRLFKDLEDPRRRDRYIGLYTKYLGEFKLVDVKNALDTYIKSENGRKDPSFNDLINLSKIERKKRENHEGTGQRRIITPEEVAADLFHKEMAKPHEKRDYKLLGMTKFYAAMFTDDEEGRENYKKHFGKSREEYESY